MSGGDIPIKITVFGIASFEGYIDRIMAPLSADAILDKMPFVLRGRFSYGSTDYWTLPGMDLREAINSKSTKNVTKGEIVYNPKTDEFILVIEDLEMPNKVNKVGKITSDIDLLKHARNGLNTKVHKLNK